MKTPSRIPNGKLNGANEVIFRAVASTTTFPGSSSASSGPSPSGASAPPVPPSRPQIVLPGLNRKFSNFAHEVGEALRDAIGDRIVPEDPSLRKNRRTSYKGDASDLNECFLCYRFGVFGRIRKLAKTGKTASSVFFERIDSQQAVTELERWIEFVIIKPGGLKVPLSLLPSTAKTLIASNFLKGFLPRVDRV